MSAYDPKRTFIAKSDASQEKTSIACTEYPLEKVHNDHV